MRKALSEAVDARITVNDSSVIGGDERSIVPSVFSINANSSNLNATITTNTSVPTIGLPTVNDDPRLSNIDAHGDRDVPLIAITVKNALSAVDSSWSDDSSASDDGVTTDRLITTSKPPADDDASMSIDLDANSVDTDILPASDNTTVFPTVSDNGSVRTDFIGSDSIDVGSRSATDDRDASKTGTSTLIVPTVPPVKDAPSLISGQVKLVHAYDDCGGFNFNYTVYMPTSSSTTLYTMLTCEQGYRCQEVEDSSTFRCNEWPSRSPVSFYGQCGGGDYDGQTFCAPGAVCKYISASFSQCLPTY